jgi:hypothetical protein
MDDFIIGDIDVKGDVSIEPRGIFTTRISADFCKADIAAMISDNGITPDEMFEEDELKDWALDNGYVEEI